jgi:CBS domain-containing protein
MMAVTVVLAIGTLGILMFALVRQHPQRTNRRAQYLARGRPRVALMILFFTTWIAQLISEWQVYTDGRLCSVVTDRDLAVKIVATGQDPDTVRLADLVDGGDVVTIGADDSVEEAIRSTTRCCHR